MSETIVITSPEGIERYRLLSIQYGLALELKGLRHSRNATVLGARAVLEKAGKPAPRTRRKLWEAFCAHMKEVYP